MNLDAPRIARRLHRALEARNYGSDETCRDIVFHMTDWLSDLERWVAFCQNPEAVGDEDVVQRLIAFLLHVPNHLAAASKLALNVPVTDIFGVGATDEDDEEDSV